ncbi:hypothetical protein [Erythrobacter sp. A6_0]|uniref:hypothetical protein n=1 Tax=Erythrobacter sp. A6_0 TaxID=2821089 RepID=UPI001ADCBEA9|nr:hypothetical protein [Erythrobacter sp. A6_0]MBO9510595.1 hypothetical protein [Erythrobacter sp. A6_0]
MTALPIRENYPGSVAVAAMPRGKPGLFGSRRPVRPAAHDGTMAHRGMPALAMSESEQEPMQEGQAMPARGLGNHWSVGSDGSTLGANIERAPQQTMQQGGPLGGSMRQPFDYDAAMKAMVGEYKKPKDWQVALAILGDGLAGAGGRQGFATQNIINQRNEFAQRQREAAEKIAGWQHDAYERQHEADLRAANPYTIGRSRLAYDPTTGETTELYRGRQDGEIYADSLGFERGSEEWNAALEDYVLRGSGPSAFERDLAMDDARTANDRGLEAYRQDNRVSLENLRQSGRAAMEGTRQANRMTLRQTPSAGRAGGAAGGKRTATDAKGNRIEWNGSAWVPAR